MAVISVVVPTLGADPALLRRCLEALRSEGGRELEVVLVAQGGRAIELPAVLVDRHFELPRNLGFARATNLGIAASSGEVIATVNDDVVVEPGWLAQLQSVLATAPAVAVQGVNLVLDRPEEVDGWGIGWNPALEAVQLGRGGAAPPLEAAPFEIFGVSATAALYRREALERAALEGGEVFDSRLGSYYEDVELALRLRAAGGLALAVPAAAQPRVIDIRQSRCHWQPAP
ncbi:MAG TPA: glycosyltransferase family 2 protein, partial [Thermoanaerobaculia bacterium]|nr:glycosyltransferase family 2 protein [Thermoanaerobaculia bacterium]